MHTTEYRDRGCSTSTGAKKGSKYTQTNPSTQTDLKGGFKDGALFLYG